jgi:hypothetical protein
MTVYVPGLLLLDPIAPVLGSMDMPTGLAVNCPPVVPTSIAPTVPELPQMVELP